MMMNKLEKLTFKNGIPLIVLGSLAGTGTLNSCIMPVQKSDKEQGRPDVILILTDDQGYGDFSVHGNPVLKTPNLDKLHSQSVRFTDFHVAPMSTPTRGQLLTGRDAMDNGATAVCMGRSMIREEIPTMADVFKSSGYKTAHFGKWHLGDSYPYRPQDRGFDLTVHHGAWGIGSIADYYKNTYWDAVYSVNDQPEKFDGYCTDVWFDLAKDYILKSNKTDPPYFMYLATNCPHAPHLCDDEYSDPYREKVKTLQEAKFLGQISNIDENVGRLMSLLDSLGRAENTIVIYMTDNGSSRGYDVFNAGMRGHKTEPYEGGHRVPLFLRWPDGRIGEPRDITTLTQCQDLLPTLIDMCSLNTGGNLQLDGQSMMPLFKDKGQDFDDRMLVVEYENPYKPEENVAVMWGRWRLVKHNELYNLASDPAQLSDVAKIHPDIVKKMSAFYEEWRGRTLPDYMKARNIHVGNKKQNPLMLYSSDWSGSYADNLGNLMAGNRVGKWNIDVDTRGVYDITLYRWHPVSGLPLNKPAEDNTGNLRGAVAVAEARLKIAGFDQTVKTTDNQTEVKFTITLDPGQYELETWFYDNSGKELCSAYYTMVDLKE